MSVKNRALWFAIVACVTIGCVVTTHEGVSEAPRGAVEPIWPPLGEPGAVPEPGAKAPAQPEEETQTEPEPTDAGETTPESIAASHILVQYKGSLRAAERVQRTKEDAKKRAEEALARARAGENFAKLVEEYSDEPGAATRGGSLGRFRHGMMVKPFEKAAFKLKPGEISDVVETPFGFHVILRTE